MHSPLPLTRDVVLIGGGHTHALVLRRWAMAPLAGARLTLINPGPTAAYSGMLPGHVAGHYDKSALEIDLIRLARFAGARLVLAAATGIDRENRLISIDGHADIGYDAASIDIGITTELPEIAGFDKHATGAKPLGIFAARWARFVADIALHKTSAEVVVIGGGVAGIELALAMMYRLRASGCAEPRVTVLDSAIKVLPGLGTGAKAALRKHMQRLGVGLMTGVNVARIEPDAVTLADGSVLRHGFCIAAAKPRPHSWLKGTGLALSDGFINVKPTLQAANDPLIYATGDCANLMASPRPKAGVFAVREAPVLYHNLRAALTRGTQRAYRPQRGYLKLISTGGKGAIADKFGLKLDGGLLWKWKNHIDLKFMRKFHDLPAMPKPDLPNELADGLREQLTGTPLCGGCGAKVGSRALASVLADLPAPRRDDILPLPGDDAALLRHGGGQQVFTTDHLRAFLPDPYRMAKIAAIHAMGDILAMGARPQAALAQIILPQMREKMQIETLREIMVAATETFRAAGAEVVGGHTSMGAEMTIGFSLSGLLSGPPIQNRGAVAGDVLILTKPIGTGTILAAEMQMKAPGDWVAACYDMMEHPLDIAAKILTPVAHAMTDITGFGLAGHCNAMMTGSNTLAQLRLADIPFLEGAETLAEAGIRSSIWQANRDAIGPLDLPDSAAATLLFDPQTAGGLLAAIPAHKAADCLERLLDAGEVAAVIGQVVRGPAGLSLT